MFFLKGQHKVIKGLQVTRGNQSQAQESIDKDFRTCFFTLARKGEALDSPSKNSKKDKSQIRLITKEFIIEKDYKRVCN